MAVGLLLPVVWPPEAEVMVPEKAEAGCRG